MTQLFISHSNEAWNKLRCRALCDWLDQHVGAGSYYVDWSGIKPGAAWDAELLRAIKQCETMVCLLSNRWFDSHQCQRELYRAWDAGKPVVPVAIESGMLARAAEIGLDRLQICDLTRPGESLALEARVDGLGSERVEFNLSELKRLRDRLRREELDPASFEWPADGDATRSPYPGLQPLGEDEAGIFFGRQLEIGDTLGLIRAPGADQGLRVLVIQGDSGVGKSSFMRAGVLARLRRDTDRYIALRPLRPAGGLITGPRGLQAAAAEWGLGTRASIDEHTSAVQGAVEILQGLFAWEARERITAEAEPRRLVLSIDQAEECFFDDNETQCQALFEALAQLARATAEGEASSTQHNPVLLLLSIRSDALHRLHKLPGIADGPLQYVVLRPMVASNFDDVIMGPARRLAEGPRRLQVEGALAARLVQDATGADALPMLALTLARLHDDAVARQSEKMTLDRYEVLTTSTGGVVQWAFELAMANPLSAPRVPQGADRQEFLLSQIFPAICSVDPVSGAVHRRVARRDTWPGESDMSHMVDRLVGHHLLVTSSADPQTSSVTWVEVAHEALFREWPLFQRWLQRLREQMTVLQGLRSATAAWSGSKRDPATLQHRSHRLHAARALLRDTALARAVLPEERAYLAACTWRRRRLSLVVGTAASCATVLAGGLTWTSIHQLDSNAFWEPAGFLLGISTRPATLSRPIGRHSVDMVCHASRDDVQDDVCLERMAPTATGPGMPAADTTTTWPAVALDSPCHMGRYEVTFYEYDYYVWTQRWKHLLGTNPEKASEPLPVPAYPPDEGGPRGMQPVVNVSIDDARAYARWLTARSSEWTWRLPTESEWEVAARSGTQTGPYPWSPAKPTSELANYKSCNRANCDVQFESVGSHPPNALDLCDMAGNVSEWVEWEQGDPQISMQPGLSIHKGGSRALEEEHLRIARRFYDKGAHPHVGFRLCRVPKESVETPKKPQRLK